MRLQAPISPRSGVMGRKEGSLRAVWPSGRPPRPARTRPNPPGPGQTAPFAGQIGLPERRGGRLGPFALPPPLRKTARGRSRDPTATPDHSPDTRRRHPPTPRLQPRKPRPQRPMGSPLSSKVIGMLRNRRSAWPGTGDRHRRNTQYALVTKRPSTIAGTSSGHAASGSTVSGRTKMYSARPAVARTGATGRARALAGDWIARSTGCRYRAPARRVGHAGSGAAFTPTP